MTALYLIPSAFRLLGGKIWVRTRLLVVVRHINIKLVTPLELELKLVSYFLWVCS